MGHGYVQAQRTTDGHFQGLHYQGLINVSGREVQLCPPQCDVVRLSMIPQWRQLTLDRWDRWLHSSVCPAGKVKPPALRSYCFVSSCVTDEISIFKLCSWNSGLSLSVSFVVSISFQFTTGLVKNLGTEEPGPAHPCWQLQIFLCCDVMKTCGAFLKSQNGTQKNSKYSHYYHTHTKPIINFVKHRCPMENQSTQVYKWTCDCSSEIPHFSE